MQRQPINIVSFSLAAITGCIGITTLVGWATSISFLIGPIPRLAAMNPMTALGFLSTSAIFVFVAVNQLTLTRVAYFLAIPFISFELVHLVDLLFDGSLYLDTCFSKRRFFHRM